MDDDLSGLTILYAEDEPIVRESVSIMLKRRIKNVITAENGAQALKLFQIKGADILITDLQMPEMGGAALAEKIKKLCPALPIIVMSAYTDKEHHIPQATATVYKPVAKENLIEAIRICLKHQINQT